MPNMLAAQAFSLLYKEEAMLRQNKFARSDYYLVTNPDLFDGLFYSVAHGKARNSSKGFPSKLKKSLELVVGAAKREHFTTSRIEQIGMSVKFGEVTLIQIPVVDPMMLLGSKLHYDHNNITLLRTEYHTPTIFSKQDKDPAYTTITSRDIEYIHQNGITYNQTPHALLHLENIFTEAKDGTRLVLAQDWIQKHEADAALIFLREVSEQLITAWTKKFLERQTKAYDKPEDRFYLSYAKDVGAISESDFRQARSYIYSGNAAVHDNALSYNSVNAVLFLDWLDEFAGRTIGHHRLKKARINGKAIGDESFEVSSKYAKTHRERRAILDQFLELGHRQAGATSKFEKIYVERHEPKGKNYHKSEVMKTAIDLFELASKQKDSEGSLVVKVHKSDELFIEALTHWKSCLHDHAGFTIYDACRAALFTYRTLNGSANIKSDDELRPHFPGDVGDPILHRFILGKNEHVSRRDKGLEEMLYENQDSIAMLREVCDVRFPWYMDQKYEFPKFAAEVRDMMGED